MIRQSKPIILASSSPIRKRLLIDCRLEFEAISPTFDEEIGKKENPHLSIKNLAMFLAQEKALSISRIHPKAIVIGSDQICELNEKAIHKSNNANEAIQQLKNFSGNIHYQNNATVVARNGKIIFKKFCRVKLKMRELSNQEITDYVNIDQPWGSAGSYKYESLGKHLFEKIDGDYFAVLGLNLQPLLNFLHRKKFINL